MRSSLPPPIDDPVRSIDHELDALHDDRRFEIRSTLAEVAEICAGIERRARRRRETPSTQPEAVIVARVGLKRAQLVVPPRGSPTFRPPEPGAHVDRGPTPRRRSP
jgi:hypothetical protein